MKNIIEIENLTFNYDDIVVYDNFSMQIKEGTFITLIGPNGTGKSTLVKVMLGLLPFDGIVRINDINLNKKTKSEIRKNIGVVFENPDSNIISETGYNDLKAILENIDMKPSNIKLKIKEVVDYLDIENIIKRPVSHLSGGEKQLISLAGALIKDPQILILDEAFSMLDGITKEKLLKLIKKIHKDKKITVINVTHDIEDSLYGEEIALIKDSEILIQGKKEEVYKEEKKFKQVKIELPFMVQLSLKLKYYDLVDDIILDMDKMVNQLWK